MVEQKRGLGRGLSALLEEAGDAEAATPGAAPTEGARTLPIELIRRNPEQPRRHFDEALRLLDEVVTAAPGYAEGWNQRAFIRFLKDDLDGSLEDIDRTLELEPKHFAALAGKAMILMRQGRMELGQAALRRAVEIHPWLKERSMLIPAPGEVVPGPGRDI